MCLDVRRVSVIIMYSHVHISCQLQQGLSNYIEQHLDLYTLIWLLSYKNFKMGNTLCGTTVYRLSVKFFNGSITVDRNAVPHCNAKLDAPCHLVTFGSSYAPGRLEFINSVNLTHFLYQEYLLK